MERINFENPSDEWQKEYIEARKEQLKGQLRYAFDHPGLELGLENQNFALSDIDINNLTHRLNAIKSGNEDQIITSEQHLARRNEVFLLESEDGFYKWLLTKGYSLLGVTGKVLEEKVESAYEEEMAHRDAARKIKTLSNFRLGLAYYLVKQLDTKNIGLGIRPLFTYAGTLTYKQVREIALAPKKPSIGDLLC